MDEFRNRTEGDAREARLGYAEWLALGAVVAGSIGAVVGAAAYSRGSSTARMQVGRPDSETLTAPHGDKLLPSHQ